MKFIKTNTPKDYWIILKKKLDGYVEQYGRLVYFNIVQHTNDTPYKLWKTYELAKRDALDDQLIYKVTIPIEGEYYIDDYVYAKDILIHETN